MRQAPILLAALLIACGPSGTSEPASIRDVEWTTLAPVPTPRTEVAAALVDGRIVVAGGFLEDGGTSAAVEIYDIAEDAWSSGPELPLPVNHAMAAADGERLYLLGGFTAEGPATDRAFALQDGEWEELPAMPEAMGAGGAAVVDGLLYVAGGVGDAGHSTRTFVFDPAAERWSIAAGLGRPRDHLGVAAFGGTVYAVGGRTEALVGNLPDAEAFDPSTGAWTRLPDLPTARGGIAAAATSNGLIVALGGEEEGGTFDEAEAFDVDERRWLTLPPMPTARHGLGVVADGTTVYAIAGGEEPALHVSAHLEAIDLGKL